MPSNRSDAEQMQSKLSLNKDNNAEFLIRWVSSARDRNWKVRLVVTAGGCMLRSNGHPSPSNTVRCFPSLGFLPFRQDGQFNGCLLMWKYTVYTVYVCVFIQARMFGSMYICVCADDTQGYWVACACPASLWTDWPAIVFNSREHLDLTDLLYGILHKWENRLVTDQLLQDSADFPNNFFTIDPLFFFNGKAQLYCVQFFISANNHGQRKSAI